MIELTPLTDTPLKTHLQYIHEWYNIGEQFGVADLLLSYNIIEYDNQRHDYQMFTIYDDDIYVGVIGFESYSCDPTSAWLAWTFVIPDMRNKGYGKVAFNILMNILKTKCYKKFYIDSVEDKNTVAFYTKLDFKYIGTCKEFRQIHSQYSKEILIYNDNPVFVMDLENL